MSNNSKFALLMQRLPPAPFVIDMQKHYRANGFYRTADVHRLLGDPRQGVSMPASDSLPFSVKDMSRRST